MKILIIVTIIFSSFNAFARSNEVIQKMLEEKYIPERAPNGETAWANVFVDGYTQDNEFQGSHLEFYSAFSTRSKYRRYRKLDSSVDKVELLPVNPIIDLDRTARAAFAAIKGDERDMVKVRFTSKSRGTYVECYYVVRNQESYLYQCGEVHETTKFENKILFHLDELMQSVESCSDTYFVKIKARVWRERSPNNVEELASFKEFDQKIGFRKIQSLQENICKNEGEINILANDLFAQFSDCDELKLFSQELNLIYDSSDEESKDLYNRVYQKPISNKLIACFNDNQTTGGLLVDNTEMENPKNPSADNQTEAIEF